MKCKCFVEGWEERWNRNIIALCMKPLFVFKDRHITRMSWIV